MTAVLLTPGPISTRLTTRNMSKTFKIAVTKQKFHVAANQLQAANLGALVQLHSGSKLHVFIKKTPQEVVDLLAMDKNSDLCTVEEYKQRFVMPTPASFKPPMQDYLVNQGLVPAEYFKVADRNTSKTSDDWLHHVNS